MSETEPKAQPPTAQEGGPRPKTDPVQSVEDPRFARTALEALNHPFYVINTTDYEVELANSAAGIDTSRRGQKCFAVTHQRSEPCDGSHHPCPLATVVRTGQPASVEHVHVDSRGNERTYEIHAYPLFDKEGRVHRIIEYNLDISERRAAEQERNRVVHFLDASSRIVSELLAADSPATAAAAVIRHLGTAARVTCAAWFEGFSEDRSEILLRRRAGWCAEGCPSRRRPRAPLVLPASFSPAWTRAVAAPGEACSATLDGLSAREREALPPQVQSFAAALLLVRGRPAGMLLLEDCEVQRRFKVDELQLLATTARAFSIALERHEQTRKRNELAAVTQQATEGVLISDGNGLVTHVNAAFCRILGLAPSQVSGHPAGRLLRRVEPRATRLGLEDSLRRSETWRGLIRVGGNRKPEAHVQSTIFPLHDDGGTLAGIASVHIDVTDHISLENQLRRAQKAEALGRFASGIAHDFNNLVQVVSGTVELLQGRADLADELQEELSVIRGVAERAKGVTRALMALSRRQMLQRTEFAVDAMVGDFIPILRRGLPETVTLEVEHGPSPGIVSADRGQIEQVLLNLCLNARDAMPDGGVLTIRTGSETIGEVYLAAHPWARPGDYVTFSVADTGHGMGEEVLSRIFEPFFTTKPTMQGSGLGLATAYGIVKQHGGMIDVDSRPGRGTTMKVLLLRSLGLHPAAPETHAVGVVGGHERILVVEDDAGVRRVTVSMLKQLGYSVTAASDGATALSLLGSEDAEYQLVISDLVMPRMGGAELHRKAIAERPRLRFLFASGYSSEAVGKQLPIGPLVGFLSKPYGLGDLARKVREVLDGGEPEGPAGVA